MNSLLLRIKNMYANFGYAEKKIADWLLANPDIIITLSIGELAAKCGCGESTIVRFSRKLGLSGYQDLKLSIAQENGSNYPIVNQSITAHDKCYDVYLKMVYDTCASLELTKKVLNSSALEQAVHVIKSANKIVLFGLGNSAAVAIDMQHKLVRVGLNAVAYNDIHMQAIAASHMKPGDVAIAITHSNSTKHLVNALDLAHKAGASTICITNFGKSSIVKKSDIVLYTASPETNKTILAMNSRIAQLTVIDSIYTCLLLCKSKNTI